MIVNGRGQVGHHGEHPNLKTSQNQRKKKLQVRIFLLSYLYLYINFYLYLFCIPALKIPHTPPDTPPRSPVKSPVLAKVPSNASITPTASPIDITTVDDGTEKITVDNDILPYSKCTLTTETTGITTIDNVSSTWDSEPSVIKKENENMNNEESNLSEASSIIQSHKHMPQKVMSTSDDSAFEVKKPVVITENELQRGNEETTAKLTQTPIVELPLQFDLRPYWEDDRLVYDFLLSGLDHEDASYLKIGFESLSQVGSDSVIHAYWSFHTSILFVKNL